MNSSNTYGTFSLPQNIRIDSEFERGQRTISIVFEDSISEPLNLKPDDLSVLLEDFAYSGSGFTFAGRQYHVTTRERDLAVSCFDAPQSEIEFVKHLIVQRLFHSTLKECSDLELAHIIMELTGSNEQLLSTLDRELVALENVHADVPPEVWERFSKSIHQDIGQIAEQLAAIYVRHFERDELMELIRFYRADVGRKSIALAPKLSQESAEVGKSWLDLYLEKIKTELRSKGYANR